MNTTWKIITGIIGSIILWIGTTLVIPPFIADYYGIDLNEVGDIFGAANALFAGLALFGAIVAVFLQQKELSLQRQELKLNRDELKKSADAQGRLTELQSLAVQLQVHQTILSSVIESVNDRKKHVVLEALGLRAEPTLIDNLKRRKQLIDSILNQIENFDYEA